MKLKVIDVIDARDKQVIASEINLIKDQTSKMLLQSSIEIGKRLNEAKEIVDHGKWTEWLAESVSYSQRTATNLIKIYTEYGTNMLENPNSQALADLGYTQAVTMLKLDFEEREKFIKENNIEEMSTRDLEAAVKEKNDILKEKIALEAKVKKMIEEKVTLETENEEADDLNEANENYITNLKEEIKVLEAEVRKKPAAADKDNKKTEKALDDLKKAKEKIKTLQGELKVKPKEIEVKQIAYQVPEETEKELKQLRLKVKSSENAVKYKATFEVVKSVFGDMISILDQMKSYDEAEYEKYKGATNKLLEALKQ